MTQQACVHDISGGTIAASGDVVIRTTGGALNISGDALITANGTYGIYATSMILQFPLNPFSYFDG